MTNTRGGWKARHATYNRSRDCTKAAVTSVVFLAIGRAMHSMRSQVYFDDQGWSLAIGQTTWIFREPHEDWPIILLATKTSWLFSGLTAFLLL
jgi:hypothetical protein